MKKTKILGIGNKDSFNYLTIEKNKNFFDFIIKLFSTIDETIEIAKYNNEGKKENVFNIIDVHEGFQRSNELTVDIFYGNKKIFITFITSENNRKRIMDKLDELGEFTNTKKTN